MNLVSIQMGKQFSTPEKTTKHSLVMILRGKRVEKKLHAKKKKKKKKNKKKRKELLSMKTLLNIRPRTISFI